MTNTDPEPAHLSDRTAAFAAAVSERKLRTDGSSSDRVARTLGMVLMVVGIAGTFLAYNNSRSLDDGRDIASNQILAIVFLAVTVVGTGLYVVGALARVLRLWLLRQLVESQDRMDKLTEALKEK
jgi:energy-converting hydrogenase Eha subunit E